MSKSRKTGRPTRVATPTAGLALSRRGPSGDRLVFSFGHLDLNHRLYA